MGLIILSFILIVNFFIIFCRSIDASHILVSRTGRVCISGLRTSISMITDGRRLPAIHDFPAQAVKMLPWLAPEVLEQVGLFFLTK